MRKHLVWVLGLALAIGIANVAIGANSQTIKGTFKAFGNVDLNKTYKPGSLNVITTTNDEDGTVSPAVRAQVYFDRDLRFFTKGIRTCRKSKLEQTDTAQAKKACPGAQVGSGTANIAFAGQANSDPVKAIVTAFNGVPKNGKPVILLHSRADAVGSTVVLTGVLKNMPRTSPFGKVLDVDIPELAFGSAITRFQVRVKKTYRFRGKRRSYVSGRCTGGGIRYRGTFTFNGSPKRTANYIQPC